MGVKSRCEIRTGKHATGPWPREKCHPTLSPRFPLPYGGACHLRCRTFSAYPIKKFPYLSLAGFRNEYPTVPQPYRVHFVDIHDLQLIGSRRCPSIIGYELTLLASGSSRGTKFGIDPCA